MSFLLHFSLRKVILRTLSKSSAHPGELPHYHNIQIMLEDGDVSVKYSISIKFFPNSILIPITVIFNQFRANKNSFSIVLYALPHEPAICPCATLKHYIARTLSLRDSTTQLFT